MTGSVSQVQTDGPLGLFENLVSVCRHGAILFHKPVSFRLRFERVDHWERIASRWRPAFSSHLISSIKGKVKKNTSPAAGTFPAFQPL